MGRVYDSRTGENLPYVKIIIDGTTMNATTDQNGYFLILNVPPGLYSVTARMIGYRSVTKTNVRVDADFTRTLEFSLESEAIAEKEAIIKVKNPIINKDVTTSIAIVLSEKIEAIPVNTIEGIVSRLPGIIIDGGYQHIRGGRGTEILYVINGVEIVDPMTGVFDSSIPIECIQEVVTYKGGFGAEYSSVQSGLVNVITKSGGSKFHLTLKARSNDAFGIKGLQGFIDENNVNDTTYLTARTSDVPTDWFRVSDGDTIYYERPFDVVTYKERGTGNYKTIYVNDTLVAEDWHPEKMKRIDFTLGGPLLGRKLRFLIGGYYFTNYGHHINKDGTYHTYTGKLTFNPNKRFRFDIHGLYNTAELNEYDARWKFNLGNRPKFEAESYSYGFVFSHSINQRVFHELRFNNYTTNLHYNVFEDGSYDINGDGIIDDDDIDGIDDFTDFDSDRNVEINGVERGFDWPDMASYPFTRAANYNDFIYKGYYRFCWGWDEKKTWTGRWDLTADINSLNEVKLGISGKYYDIFDYNVDMASGGNVFVDWVKVYPYQLSAYIQDKLELKSFFLSAGARFDYFNPNSNNLPADPENPVVDIARGGEILNPVQADVKWTISPRIGFSYMITNNDKLHFSFGRYLQIPPMYTLFWNMNYNFTYPFPFVGNPNIKPEKTTFYELCIQHAFNNEILIDITAYLKYVSDLINTEQIFYTVGDYYTRYINVDNGSSRGIEIKFSKTRGGTPAWLTWNISYILSIAKGQSSSTRQNYDIIWAGYIIPDEEHYLNWDQRHTVKADIGIHAPAGEALFEIPGLDNFGINFTINYGSGFPWSPPPRTREVLINTERLPYNFRADMRFHKNFKVGKVTLGLFGDIYHLFNHTNINRWYLDLYNYESWYKAYGDPSGQFKDPRVYSAKRYMRFGISIKW
jgi:outer membrane receptor protein involved in Fe transport